VKLLIAIVCVASLWGCTSQQIDSAGHTVASAAPALVNDALLVAQIESTFVTIDADSALHTSVSSHHGVVTLGGAVKSASIRDRFVASAKATQGVTGVKNTLAIDPHLPSARNQAADFAVTVAVEGSLAAQAGINALPVHVVAHAGAVTLSGTVDSAALASTMVAAAKKTPGVTSVVDRLSVKS